jgi:hypothetical protein
MAHESIEAVRASGASKHEIKVEAHSWEPAVQQGSTSAIKDIFRILNKFGADMYIAAHWHYYESLWPAKDGTTGTGGDLLTKSFVNPKKTIHVTTGNGGPPRKDNFNEGCPGPDCGKIPSTRFQVGLPPLPCSIRLPCSRPLFLFSSPFLHTHAPSICQSTEFGYGKLVAHNSSHLTYSQTQNKDGIVSDTWVLVKNTHTWPFNSTNADSRAPV